MPEINIKAEPIFSVFGLHITNSLFTSIIATVTFLLIAIYYSKQITASKKSVFFYFVHFVFKSINDLFKSILGDNIKFFLPLVLSFFLFILIQNWFGLLPGVGSVKIAIKEYGKIVHVPIFRGGNADLNTTLALALISVVMIQFYGVKFLGFLQYIKKFIDLSNPINFFVGVLEIISEISKVLSFAFRLFGNIFAGEVLLTIVAFLVPVLASFPFIILELFVGFVQALVFAMLTTVFLNGAIAKHH